MIHKVREFVRGISREALITTALALVAWATAVGTALAGTTPQIAPNYMQTCALVDTGTVYCMGENGSGQLGTGGTDDSTEPVAVRGISSAVGIASGDATNCALIAGGSVECWGDDNEQQLGNGPGTEPQADPAPVLDLSNAKQISGSDYTFCAVTADGAVKCWGKNGASQGGSSTDGDLDRPTAVAGISGAVKVAAGGIVSCALISDGTVRCWGDNTNGALGSTLVAGESATPAAVQGIAGAKDIVAGHAHACALLADGTVKCWGQNGSWGALGAGGEPSKSATPVTVSGVSGATAIAAGLMGGCALLADATVMCWGAGTQGEIGDGLAENAPLPRSVTGLAGVSAIASSFDGTMCAMTADGSVSCWGDNAFGQTGGSPGETPKRVTPAKVAGLNLLQAPAAAVSVPAAGPVPAATPVAPPPAASGPKPAALALLKIVGKPVLDARRKNFVVRGKVAITPAGSLPDGCSGVVRAIVKPTKGKAVRSTAKLALKRGACAATFALKLPAASMRGTRQTLTATFAGNSAVQQVTLSQQVKLPRK